jgi:uncharacterized protein YcfJ
MTMENEMIKTTFITLAGVAGLLLANSTANAQSYGHRAYCDDYARRVAYRASDPNAVVGGVVTGAILGGAVGAITGQGHASNIGTGVAVGGVTGGVLGAAGSQGHFSQRTYDEAYWKCMNRFKFRANDRPVRYSRNRDWCISRYRSFDPATGLYLSSSGQYRHCP